MFVPFQNFRLVTHIQGSINKINYIKCIVVKKKILLYCISTFICPQLVQSFEVYKRHADMKFQIMKAKNTAFF